MGNCCKSPSTKEFDMKEFNDAWGFKQPKELTLHRVPTVTNEVANAVTNAVTNEVAPVDTTQIIMDRIILNC